VWETRVTAMFGYVQKHTHQRRKSQTSHSVNSAREQGRSQTLRDVLESQRGTEEKSEGSRTAEAVGRRGFVERAKRRLPVARKRRASVCGNGAELANQERS
jgi:hypothetical protein